MGFATRQQVVSLPGSGQSSNVIASQSGTATSDRKNLIVVAHLDSVNHPGGDLAPAPGADDNASGSAGVLVLAEALSTHTPANSRVSPGHRLYVPVSAKVGK